MKINLKKRAEFLINMLKVDIDKKRIILILFHLLQQYPL